MNLSANDLKALHDLAVETAKEAGVHIQSRVHNHRGPQAKDSGDTPASQVVTEVDHESQDLILSRLTDSIVDYELGLLTEESEDNSSRLERDAFWCIDPIDGTLPFTEGVPGYSVSIALVSREGKPLIGVIHDPVMKTTYHAFLGSEAMRDGKVILSGNEYSASHLTWTQDRSMKKSIGNARAREFLEELAYREGFDGLKILDHAGSVLNACWVSQNQPAVYFKFPKPTQGGGSVWDFAATACLFNEWGQPPTDIHGETLNLNPEGSTFMNEKAVVYASSPELRKAIHEFYRDLKA